MVLGPSERGFCSKQSQGRLRASRNHTKGKCIPVDSLFLCWNIPLSWDAHTHRFLGVSEVRGQAHIFCHSRQIQLHAFPEEKWKNSTKLDSRSLTSLTQIIITESRIYPQVRTSGFSLHKFTSGSGVGEWVKWKIPRAKVKFYISVAAEYAPSSAIKRPDVHL